MQPKKGTSNLDHSLEASCNISRSDRMERIVLGERHALEQSCCNIICRSFETYYTKLRKHHCPDHARFPPLLAHDSEAPAGVEVIVLVTLQHK